MGFANTWKTVEEVPIGQQFTNDSRTRIFLRIPEDKAFVDAIIESPVALELKERFGWGTDPVCLRTAREVDHLGPFHEWIDYADPAYDE